MFKVLLRVLEGSMSVLWAAVFVGSPILFLVGAVVLKSMHLLLAGLLMGVAAALFFAINKGIAGKRRQQQSRQARSLADEE